MQFAFFILETLKNFVSKTIDFVEKSGNDSNSREQGLIFFASLWRNAYEYQCRIHSLLICIEQITDAAAVRCF